MDEVEDSSSNAEAVGDDSSDNKDASERSKEKSKTEEVSQILTTLSDSVSHFGTASKSLNMDQSSTDAVMSVQADGLLENHEQGCHENSSPPLSSSSSSSDDEDESEAESSELDEEDCNRRRSQCIDEMTTIEKQFMDIRDQLYRERHTQITNKLNEVNAGTAPEYLQQVQTLEKNKQIRMQVSELLRRLQVESLQAILEAEKLATTQHLNNEKKMLKEQIQADIDEKIHLLEEDRNNVDLSTELWTDATLGSGSYAGDSQARMGKKHKRKEENEHSFGFGSIKRKKKPVTVTGPYIVYMLKDSDVMDDWTAIKMAINIQRHKNTSKGLRKSFTCGYENGKLLYAGKQFQEGQHVLIRTQRETTILGTITGISQGEVLVQQNNGAKTKVHFRQLKRGLITLQQR